MDVEALLNTLPKTLRQAEVNTLGDTLGDVVCEALVHTSNDTLAKVERVRHLLAFHKVFRTPLFLQSQPACQPMARPSH